MESGIYALPRKLTVTNTDQVFLTRTPVATTVSGVLNIGDGPFDGISPNKFVGTNTGTYLAINGTGGIDPINIQNSGVSAFKVQSNSWVIMSGACQIGQLVCSALSPSGGTDAVWTANDTTHSFIVRGVANQTADLQKWQDNTPKTLANITSAGVFNDSTGLGAAARLQSYMWYS